MNVDADMPWNRGPDPLAARELSRPTRPIPPDQDPFCLPPLGFERTAPGTVLRSRTVELALLGLIPQKITAWQLLYRTSDLHGAAEVTLTTVVLPAGADPHEPRPLLSYQCAIDAVAAKGSPSYGLRRGAVRAIGSCPQLELALVASALQRGWAVSIPDHGGVQGRFGVPREPGYRALDGIRAALSFAPLGLHRDCPIVLWGYSGGGLATSWAAEMAAQYAPELGIVGAAAGSPVGDPEAIFGRLNGSIYAGFPIAFIAGLRRAYPELDRIVRATSNSVFLNAITAAEGRTTGALLARFAFTNVEKHTSSSLAEIFAEPEMRAVLDDVRPGGQAPAFPMFVLQGVHDRVIAIDAVDGQVNRYAASGGHVRYVRDRLSGHGSLGMLGAPIVMDWLSERIDDQPLAPAGTETVWSVTFSKEAATAHLRLGVLFGRLLFGRPIRLPKRRPGNSAAVDVQPERSREFGA